MATATAMPNTQTFWARLGERLSNWGGKIKGFAFRVGSYITRAARWLYHTKAAQWVVTKASFVAGKVWHVAKGPVGWIAAPIAAIIFAPKAVAVMLFLVLVLIAVLAYLVYRLTREMKNASPEDFEEIKEGVADIGEAIRDGFADIQMESADGVIVVDDMIDPDETLDDRYDTLDKGLGMAIATADGDLMSEYTGRSYLVLVRRGADSKLKKDASVSAIHRACRKKAEGEHPTVEWNWNRMYQAVRAEDKRLKDTAELKAKGSHLTSV
jgi:hypothetical protein